jgi:hypothetical protein
MKMTGENRSTRRKACSTATLSTINSTWTGLALSPGFEAKRQATDCLNHGAALSYLL